MYNSNACAKLAQSSYNYTMDVTLFMAMSVNGMIATEDGGEDFLSHENWKSFSRLVDKFGCFIVGGNTYAAVKNWDSGYGFDDFTKAKKVVVTNDESFSVDAGYELVTSPKEAVEKLSDAGFEKALLSGGAYTNTLFMQAGLIQSVIVNIEPVLIGQGKPLFYPANFQKRLKLQKNVELPESIFQLHYGVEESASEKK